MDGNHKTLVQTVNTPAFGYIFCFVLGKQTKAVIGN